MEYHPARFIERVMCGSEIVTTRFTRPTDYTFLPGQYFMLRLTTAEGMQSKPFSLAGAPADDFIEVTTRLSDSPFKTALMRLDRESDVEVSSAAGHLVIPEATRKIVFLSGGVGITPVHSILRDAVGTGRDIEAVLFFGNRDISCIPYRDELARMSAPTVSVINVLEHPPADWGGESGFISSAMVRRYLDPADGWLFVVAGPPVMVAAMEKCLDELEVPAGLRLIERFGGYA